MRSYETPTAPFTQQIDFPWSILTADRKLQLLWWERFGADALRYVAVPTELEPIIRSRPPDRFRYVGEENHRSDHVERRHTVFKTWPVKVVVDRVYDHLGLYWDLPDGRQIGLKVAVNERTYTHEEEVAGA